jgi:6-phosphogluconolactonase
MRYYLYVSLQTDNKILAFSMDPNTGKLALRHELAAPGGPAPLAVDPYQDYMYVGRRGVCKVSSYRIIQSTGALRGLGTVSLAADPCFLSTDRSGRFLLSAYYKAGKVAVHPHWR